MLDTKSFQKSDVFSGDKTKYQNWSKKLKAMAAEVYDKGRQGQRVVGQVGEEQDRAGLGAHPG